MFTVSKGHLQNNKNIVKSVFEKCKNTFELINCAFSSIFDVKPINLQSLTNHQPFQNSMTKSIQTNPNKAQLQKSKLSTSNSQKKYNGAQ